MRKTYTAPSVQAVAFDTEEIMDASFPGNLGILKDKTEADKNPSSGFGNVTLF